MAKLIIDFMEQDLQTVKTNLQTRLLNIENITPVFFEVGLAEMISADTPNDLMLGTDGKLTSTTHWQSTQW